MSAGTVSILSVGTGDTKLTFDKTNPAETIRAARIVKDMLRRGYALMVEWEEGGAKKYRRATGFDETVNEYIIADCRASSIDACGRSDVLAALHQHAPDRPEAAL